MAVDARVDQVHHLARRVDEVLAGRAAHGVRLVPDLVRIRVVLGLRALQLRGVGQFGGVDRETGRHLGRRHVDGAGFVQLEQDRSQDQGRGEGAAQDRILLHARGGADQVAGLEVLRGGAGITGGDADDGADRQRGHVVLAAGPAHHQEDQAGEQQGRHGHARDRVRRRADLAGQARRDGGEQEAEHQDQHRAQHVHVQRRGQRDDGDDGQAADHHPLHRDVAVGAQRLVAFRTLPHARQAAAQAVPDRRQRARQRDQAAGRHRAGADIQDVRGADVVARHVADRDRGRRQRHGRQLAEELDHRDQQERGQHAAGRHRVGDARADDVADAHQLGRDFGADAAGLERRAELEVDGVAPALERHAQGFIQDADAEAAEDQHRAPFRRLDGLAVLRARPCARFACSLARDVGGGGLEDLGAGRAFRVFQFAVLVDDQRAAQRDHHQDAEQAAQHADQHHARDLEVETEDHDGRHGHAQAEGQRFAGRTRGLGHAVLEDRRFARAELLRHAEQGDRDHRHRDRGADRQAHLQHQVERGRAEDHAQDDAHDQGARGHFGQLGGGGDVGLEVRGLEAGRFRIEWHGFPSLLMRPAVPPASPKREYRTCTNGKKAPVESDYNRPLMAVNMAQ